MKISRDSERVINLESSVFFYYNTGNNKWEDYDEIIFFLLGFGSQDASVLKFQNTSSFFEDSEIKKSKTIELDIRDRCGTHLSDSNEDSEWREILIDVQKSQAKKTKTSCQGKDIVYIKPYVEERAPIHLIQIQNSNREQLITDIGVLFDELFYLKSFSQTAVKEIVKENLFKIVKKAAFEIEDLKKEENFKSQGEQQSFIERRRSLRESVLYKILCSQGLYTIEAVLQYRCRKENACIKSIKKFFQKAAYCCCCCRIISNLCCCCCNRSGQQAKHFPWNNKNFKVELSAVTQLEGKGPLFNLPKNSLFTERRGVNRCFIKLLEFLPLDDWISELGEILEKEESKIKRLVNTIKREKSFICDELLRFLREYDSANSKEKKEFLLQEIKGKKSKYFQLKSYSNLHPEKGHYSSESILIEQLNTIADEFYEEYAIVFRRLLPEGPIHQKGCYSDITPDFFTHFYGLQLNFPHLPLSIPETLSNSITHLHSELSRGASSSFKANSHSFANRDSRSIEFYFKEYMAFTGDSTSLLNRKVMTPPMNLQNRNGFFNIFTDILTEEFLGSKLIEIFNKSFSQLVPEMKTFRGSIFDIELVRFSENIDEICFNRSRTTRQEPRVLSNKYSGYLLFYLLNQINDLRRKISMKKREMIFKSLKTSKKASKKNGLITIAMTSNESFSGSILQTENTFERTIENEDNILRDLLKRKRKLSRVTSELSLVYFNSCRLQLAQKKEPERSLLVVGTVVGRVY